MSIEWATNPRYTQQHSDAINTAERRLQWVQTDGGGQPPGWVEPPHSRAPPAASPSVSPSWPLSDEFEETVGKGFNAWALACYPHAHYTQFSMAFGRLFASLPFCPSASLPRCLAASLSLCLVSSLSSFSL